MSHALAANLGMNSEANPRNTQGIVVVTAAHENRQNVPSVENGKDYYVERDGIKVLVLAESHISIHSWPERGYAALDVFMCGDCDPYLAIPVLKEAFAPAYVTLAENKRGLTP